MSKTIDAITLMKINDYLKQQGFPCHLHSAGACDQSTLRVEDMGDMDIQKLCETINQFLESSWVKVAIESPNSHFLKII